MATVSRFLPPRLIGCWWRDIGTHLKRLSLPGNVIVADEPASIDLCVLSEVCNPLLRRYPKLRKLRTMLEGHTPRDALDRA
jgi:hypothetical protein